MQDPADDVVVTVDGGVKGPDEVEVIPVRYVMTGQQRGSESLQQPRHVGGVGQDIVTRTVDHDWHVHLLRLVLRRCGLKQLRTVSVPCVQVPACVRFE